jgi:hypothetical protein
MTYSASATHRGEYFDTFELNKIPSIAFRYEYTRLFGEKLDSKRSGPIARSFCQVRLDKPQIVEKSEIFEATRQLVKAITWEYVSRLGKFPFRPRSEDIIFLDLPTIVFDGPMYEAALSDERLVLNPIDHLIVRADHRRPGVSDPYDFYIDVVSKQSFGRWLRKMKKALASTTDIVHDKALLTERRKLRKQLPSK